MWIPDLATSRDIAARPDLQLHTRILAADVLTAHGELDVADRLLAELRRVAWDNPHIGTVVRASATLRAFEVPGKLAGMRDLAAELNGDFEAVVADRERPACIILVFTDITQRFWLSLPVLHLFLEPFNGRIIYLKDARNEAFLSGLQGFGGTYAHTLAGLEAWLGADRDQVHVLACSAGGFVGLKAAIDLKVRSFLGFGVRTDLSPRSPLPINGAAARLKAEARRPDMLIDLRPELHGKAHPGAVTLYAGAANLVDIAHADHLRATGRVRVETLPTKSHNSVQQLVADGGFAEALARHLRSAAEGSRLPVS